MFDVDCLDCLPARYSKNTKPCQDFFENVDLPVNNNFDPDRVKKMAKILIVDDSKTIRQQVSFVLNKSGHDVLEADDGASGFQCLENNSDIDLIISDVNMPMVNGLDMLERIYEEKSTENIPVIMLTTEANPEMIARARKAGAKGWMVKPFEPEKLVETVNCIIKK